MTMKFNKFEKVCKLLEQHSPEEINGEILESYGLDANDVPSIIEINEGFLEFLSKLSNIEVSVNEGIFDGIKNLISKALPGGAINKAEKILSKYNKTEKQALQKIAGFRATAHKAFIKANNNPDEVSLAKISDEMDDRSRTSAKIVMDSRQKEREAIKNELDEFLKDKPERVRTYVKMRQAQIDGEMAKLDADDAEKYASEKEMEKMEKNVKREEEKTKNLAIKMKQQVDGKKDTTEIDKKIEQADKTAKAEDKKDNESKQAA